MALAGCGEVWTSVSSALTAWVATATSGTTWTEAATYCPIITGPYYDSSAYDYDDATISYDET